MSVGGGGAGRSSVSLKMGPFVGGRVLYWVSALPPNPRTLKGSKEGSSSFLKKRTKKLLFVCLRQHDNRHAPKGTKVFWFFFSKKNCFLAVDADTTHPDARGA
jgi:hypothetical protein